VSGQDFLHVKGVVETLLDALHIAAPLELADFRHALVVAGQASELRLFGKRLGFLGDVAPAALKALSLRGPATILELSLDVLAEHAQLATKVEPQSPYPTIARDVNLIVDEAVRWGDLAATAHAAAGPDLERLAYLDTYRDPQKDGPGKKRLLFSLTLRAKDRTLTGQEADAIRDAVVAACTAQHGAKLLS
jgi:phenylalanyl-tRNA synthetase beta chain